MNKIISSLSFNKNIMICLLSSTLVLGSSSMAFGNDIPEDYLYNESYSHEQGENRGVVNWLKENIAWTLAYEGASWEINSVINNWDTISHHNSYSPYNDFMFFGP